MTSPSPERPPRGPLDPGIFALSPSIRRHLVVSTVLSAVTTVAVLAQAEVLAGAIPRLVDGDREMVAGTAIALGMVAAVRALAAAGVDRSATATAIATRRDVGAAILQKVTTAGAEHRRELGPARVAALTTTASDALEPWIRSYLPGLPLAVLLPLAAGLRILGADLTSALILVVVVPLIPVFMVLIGRATERQSAAQWDALARLANRFLDVITGLPTLRLFGRADAQVARVREVTDRYRSATMRTLRVAFLSALVLELLATLSVALVAVALGGRLVHGGLDLQTALVVLLLTPECLLPIRRVAAAFHAATAGVDAAAEVHRALAVPNRPGGSTPCPERGDLVAAGVGMVDPIRGPRLEPVDLRVAPGSVTAVAGPSGAGKSTLLDLLRGASSPSSGSVTMDGLDLSTLDPRTVRRVIRWIPQRANPLGETVLDAAMLGVEDRPGAMPAASAALVRLGLAELSDRPPEDASGGERRRIALARALTAAEVDQVGILLLDEPTAQLDQAAAARVRDEVRRVAAAGVAVVAATHDPSLIAIADQVIQLAPDPTAAPDARHDPNGQIPGARHRRPDTAPVPDPVAGWAAEIASDVDAAGTGSLRWLLGQASGQRTRLAGAVGLGVLTDACSVALAATAAWLIVRASAQPSFADLAVAAVGVRAFALGKGVLRYAERLTSHDATLRLLADLRATVIARLARLAPTGLPKGARGDLLARLVDDIDRMQDLFLRVLGPLAASLTVGVVAAVAATTIDPWGGLALLVAVLAVGLLLPAVAHAAARTRGARSAELRGQLATSAVELADDAEELIAASAADRWMSKIAEGSDRLDDVERRQGRWSAAIAACVAGAPAIATAAVVASLAGRQELTGPAVGVLVLLPLAVMELIGPLASAGEALARVEASASRVLALLRRPDPVPEPAAPAATPATDDIRLTDVSVGWPGGPPVVTGLGLHVPPGGRAVVTGPSGSGKSTVAAMLVAFLAPSRGTYDLGGTNVTALGGEEVRRHVTWCQQDPWFADSTLADNLRIAQPEATDDALWSVLATVHLAPWARGLPSGLSTRLGRDAREMSGGERQRLALARALLGGQGALVLDEPTSHLDERTAADVLDDLLAAAESRAVVLITHGAPPGGTGPVHRLTRQPG